MKKFKCPECGADLLKDGFCNTVEMKIDEFEKFRINNPDKNYCNGNCEECLNCYEELNPVTINRLRKKW